MLLDWFFLQVVVVEFLNMLLQLNSLSLEVFLLLPQEFQLEIVEDIVVSFDHLKFIYQIDRPRCVQIHRPEVWLDVYL